MRTTFTHIQDLLHPQFTACGTNGDYYVDKTTYFWNANFSRANKLLVYLMSLRMFSKTNGCNNQTRVVAINVIVPLAAQIIVMLLVI